MKIIQTFWSGGSTSLLQNSFGWYNAEYHIQGWALSCQLLRRLYDEVELYTDKIGYDLLINKLQLPYSKVHVELDELNTYPNHLWALSKIYSYSKQTTPFIHIDGDVFLWNQFDQGLLKGNLISQNLEFETQYFEDMWVQLEDLLEFIPEEIKEKRKENSSIVSYNFGIFGGNNLDFIQQFCIKAFEFVDKNLASFDNLRNLNFNIFFEQYLFMCLLKDQKMSCYFSEDFGDTQYKGFGNFDETPHRRDYLHLMGDFKKNLEVCRKMSRQLALEFPEQYHRCLQVFNSQEQTIFQSSLFQNTTISHTTYSTFSNYYLSAENTVKFYRTYSLLKKHPKAHHNQLDEIFTSTEKTFNEIQNLDDPSISKIFSYEKKIYKYLSSLEIDLQEYARYDYGFSKRYQDFIQQPQRFSYRKSLHLSTISESILTDDDLHHFYGEDISKEFQRCIKPSCSSPFYEETILGDIQELVLEACSRKYVSFHQLLSKLETCFDKEDLQQNYNGFLHLITEVVRKLVYKKIIDIKKIQSKIPDTKAIRGFQNKYESIKSET